MLRTSMSANFERANPPADRARQAPRPAGKGGEQASGQHQAGSLWATAARTRDPHSNLHEKGRAQNQPSQGDEPDAASHEAHLYQKIRRAPTNLARSADYIMHRERITKHYASISILAQKLHLEFLRIEPIA